MKTKRTQEEIKYYFGCFWEESWRAKNWKTLCNFLYAFDISTCNRNMLQGIFFNIHIIVSAFTLWFIYSIYLTIFLFTNKPIQTKHRCTSCGQTLKCNLNLSTLSSINFCRVFFLYLRCWNLDSSWLKLMSVEYSSPEFNKTKQKKNRVNKIIKWKRI